MVSSWIPSICGLLQFQLSRIYGFDKVMNFWFGSEAEAVSFNYGSFKTAGGEIFRIPATFTFATQYAYFLIGAFCFSLIAYDLEKDRNWKRFTLLTLLLLLAASVTSGTRALLFAIPLIPLAFLAIKRGVHSAIGAGIFLIVLNSVMAIATTFNPFEIAKSFAYLFQFYFTVWVPNAVKMAVLRYPLGAGTGSATHQARHLGQRIADNLIQNEGQYTKAIIELGIPGVVILIFLLLITPTVNFRNIFRTSDKNIKAICSSLLIYQGIIAVYCLKANPLDQDPTNMLYWISVGISYRVNSYLNFNESLNETQRAHVPALA